MEELRITRRASLARLGGFLAAALTAGGWRAHEAASEGVGPAGVASGGVSCVLTPEQTEGPYYIADEKLRRNITEGKSGTPLRLNLSVVDSSTCRPIKGAVVDIWHADATGVYSGFGQGSGNRTFLRGIQKTDAKGVATFRTVYPGWYPGRTVHIHVKVHLGGNVVHTGQLYFPDTVTDAAYRQLPYRKPYGWLAIVGATRRFPWASSVPQRRTFALDSARPLLHGPSCGLSLTRHGHRQTRAYDGLLRLAQRACAALRADSARSSGVNFAARAFPPFSPPLRPSATAAGSFPASGSILSASPVASSTSCLASSFTSVGRLRDRSGIPSL